MLVGCNVTIQGVPLKSLQVDRNLGVPGLTIRTQQDRVQMSPAFELELTYVKISLGLNGKPLVGTLKGCSRRGTPWEVRLLMAHFGGQKH